MKNKVVCALLCGVFCLTISAATVTSVQAAPVAGVISALTGESGTVEKKTAAARTGTAELLTADTEGGHTVGVTADLFSLNNTEKTDTEAEEASDTKVSGVIGTLSVSLTEAGTAAEEEPTETEAAEEETEENAEAAEEAADEGEAAADGDEAKTTDEDFSKIGIAVVTDYVNVRSEASAESEAVGKLYANNALEVVGTNDDGSWYEIVSGDLRGFVSAEFVSVGDEDLIKQATHRVATVHTETLFVRALPTQESEVIGMVPDQEILTVVDEQYVNNWGWVGVSIEEGSGYVSMEFVDLSTEYTFGETKEAEEARLNRHLGLVSMKERSQLLNGKFDLKTGINKGTEITIELPIFDIEEEEEPKNGQVTNPAG